MITIIIKVEVSRVPDKSEALDIEWAVEELLTEMAIKHDLANLQ
jgi:hypothetical protein